MVTDTWNKQLL